MEQRPLIAGSKLNCSNADAEANVSEFSKDTWFSGMLQEAGLKKDNRASSNFGESRDFCCHNSLFAAGTKVFAIYADIKKIVSDNQVQNGQESNSLPFAVKC